MIVLGVDPGSEVTGYGIVEDLPVLSDDSTGYRALDFGCIRNDRRTPFPQKLQKIHRRIMQLLDAYRIDAVALEEVFYAVNVKTALKLGHSRGVILLAAAQAQLPVFEYSPLEVKSAVVGYGRADKRQIQEMVKLLLGLDTIPQPHDAADALAVAICHLNSIRLTLLGTTR